MQAPDPGGATYRRPASGYRRHADAPELARMRQQLGYLRDINAQLDRAAKGAEAAERWRTGAVSTVDLSGDVERLGTKYELWQGQNALLVSELAGARIALTRLEHEIEQAELANRGARAELAELARQQRDAMERVMLQNELRHENAGIQREIEQQDQLIQLLEGQIALYRRLAGGPGEAAEAQQ